MNSETAIDVHVHLPPDVSATQLMIRSAEANGVGKMFVAGLGRGEWKPFPTDPEVSEANEDTFALCDRRPALVRGYVYLNPRASWEKELARWRGHSAFVGVKLWVSCKDDRGSADVCLPLLQCAGEAGFAVLCHSFFRSGPNLPGELSPADLAALARRAPQTRIIMAHCGGTWEKGLRAVADCANVYVDISGGPAWRGLVECAVMRCGVARVLFGSDMPCRTLQSQLHKVRSAELSDAEAAAILAGNARALFGSRAR